MNEKASVSKELNEKHRKSQEGLPKMLRRWKGPGSSRGQQCWNRAYLIVFSVVLISCSAVYLGQYRWRCVDYVQSTLRTPTNLSHIVFGIGGSAQMWLQRRSYVELWWRPGEMRGHVWLDEEPPEAQAWPGTCPPYRVSADASRFGERAGPSRVARIVVDAYRELEEEEEEEEEESVRWFVMGDDDTVFFPENLVTVLGKYDHREMWYIGGSSESLEQIGRHSFNLAYGGGGFAVSRPAAALLARVFDGCLDRYNYMYGGDQRVQSCLSELGVPLTREPGFHQLDIRGNAYGMLAAHPVAPLVSLHHLDFVDPILPRGSRIEALRSLVSAFRSDPARIIQQCFCYESGAGYNWSVMVSWGYTVQLYALVMYPNELEVPLQTFRTWRSFKRGPFTFNIRVKTDDPCEWPFVFTLDRVQQLEGAAATLTEYSRTNQNDSKCDNPAFREASKVETVRVFARKMDPTVWSQAPRRQCCRTRRMAAGNVMEVRIRNCGPGEVVTPP